MAPAPTKAEATRVGVTLARPAASVEPAGAANLTAKLQRLRHLGLGGRPGRRIPSGAQNRAERATDPDPRVPQAHRGGRAGAPFNAVGGVLRPRMMTRRRRLVVSEICRHRARQDPTSRYRIHPRRARSHRAKASAMSRHGRHIFAAAVRMRTHSVGDVGYDRPFSGSSRGGPRR